MKTFITAVRESSLGFYVDASYVMLLKQKDESLVLNGFWFGNDMQEPWACSCRPICRMYFTRRNWIGSIRKFLL